ncbi:MAG: type I asparaginase [Bacteroidales bacterium]|nr:type I asparaginase [Bacteroidales bacterium]
MRNILVIYTGGTIGMTTNKNGVFIPFEFDNIQKYIPELSLLNIKFNIQTLHPILDSSNIVPDNWIQLLELIKINYDNYDGFVILHGTDTMTFTASALSFMIENLKKPIILTGSQLPLCEVRTDAKENFLTSLMIASDYKDNCPIVPEVCIFFENKLFRGNRTIKYSATQFNAFASPNYPELAYAGIEINYNLNFINKPVYNNNTIFFNKLDNNIAIIHLYPGINQNIIESVVNIPNLKAIIILTYGTGNAPTFKWFLNCIEHAIKNNIIVLNITQCIEGKVKQGQYETSYYLQNLGVISGKDMTLEAAITKLMFLLGNFSDYEEIKKLLSSSIRGELT